MITVSGLNRKNGMVRTQSYAPGNEGPARKYREHLRSHGYNTVLVNDVKERYAAKAAAEREEPFSYEGITGYQLHSQGTGRGNMKDSHITKAKTSTLVGAIEEAEKLVGKWSDGHKGIVIYRAIKLVRKIVKPTTEIVELS